MVLDWRSDTLQLRWMEVWKMEIWTELCLFHSSAVLKTSWSKRSLLCFPSLFPSGPPTARITVQCKHNHPHIPVLRLFLSSAFVLLLYSLQKLNHSQTTGLQEISQKEARDYIKRIKSARGVTNSNSVRFCDWNKISRNVKNHLKCLFPPDFSICLRFVYFLFFYI